MDVVSLALSIGTLSLSFFLWTIRKDIYFLRILSAFLIAYPLFLTKSITLLIALIISLLPFFFSPPISLFLILKNIIGKGALLSLHIASSSLGYLFVSLGFLLTVIEFIIEKKIKEGKTITIPIDYIERSKVISLSIGIFFLFFGIALGFARIKEINFGVKEALIVISFILFVASRFLERMKSLLVSSLGLITLSITFIMFFLSKKFH